MMREMNSTACGVRGVNSTWKFVGRLVLNQEMDAFKQHASIPDNTSRVFYLGLDIFSIRVFLLVDIQSGKRHCNHNEHVVYGKVHTWTDPPTKTKRVCEWVTELLCLFVLCGLHEAVGVERKGVRI